MPGARANGLMQAVSKKEGSGPYGFTVKGRHRAPVLRCLNGTAGGQRLAGAIERTHQQPQIDAPFAKVSGYDPRLQSGEDGVLALQGAPAFADMALFAVGREMDAVHQAEPGHILWPRHQSQRPVVSHPGMNIRRRNAARESRFQRAHLPCDIFQYRVLIARCRQQGTREAFGLLAFGAGRTPAMTGCAARTQSPEADKQKDQFSHCRILVGRVGFLPPAACPV